MLSNASYFAKVLALELIKDKNIYNYKYTFLIPFFRLWPRKINNSTDKGVLVVWLNHVYLKSNYDVYLDMNDKRCLFRYLRLACLNHVKNEK